MPGNLVPATPAALWVAKECFQRIGCDLAVAGTALNLVKLMKMRCVWKENVIQTVCLLAAALGGEPSATIPRVWRSASRFIFGHCWPSIWSLSHSISVASPPWPQEANTQN